MQISIAVRLIYSLDFSVPAIVQYLQTYDIARRRMVLETVAYGEETEGEISGIDWGHKTQYSIIIAVYCLINPRTPVSGVRTLCLTKNVGKTGQQYGRKRE